MNTIFFHPLVIAAFLTFLFCPIVIVFAKRFHLVDDPKKRYHPAHIHTGLIPRAGGLALFFGLTITIVFFLPVTKLLVGLIFALLLLTVVGLIDDRSDVNPYVRLLTNALATVTIILSGASIPYITNPIGEGVILFTPPLSALIAFLWIMWTTNIIGWSAGVDGQMPGFVAISAFVLGILSLRYSLSDPAQLPITLLAFATSGAFLGFLPWNFSPQKIMPGYGGKTIAGFLLGVLSILSFAKLGTAIMVLGIPVMDAIFTLVRRIGKRKSPVQADRGHLHHLLLDLGWGKRKIALFYWGVSAILGTTALVLDSRQKVFAILIIAVLFTGFLLWIHYFSQLSKQPDPDNG